MLNKKELANILSVSIPTIDNLMKKNMPYYKVGKCVRFELDEVKQWLKNKKG